MLVKKLANLLDFFLNRDDVVLDKRIYKVVRLSFGLRDFKPSHNRTECL